MGFLVNCALIGSIMGVFLAGDLPARQIVGKDVIPIRVEGVAAHSDGGDLGQYYTLEYQLPHTLSGDAVQHVFLEMFVDVATKYRDGLNDETPIIEVYALTGRFAERIDPQGMDSVTRAARPVAVGQGRRVVLDVTSIVRAQAYGRLHNHGLVVGNVTGLRNGDFRIVPGQLPGGAVAQLCVYTEVRPQ